MQTARTPARDLEPELLDAVCLPAAEAHRALADLERVTFWLGGLLPVQRALLPQLGRERRRHRLLDLGTGSGQVPAAMVRAAARAGIRLDAYGVDRKLSHLLFGRSRGHRQHRVVASVDALPFRDRAFDCSLSTLLLHHFQPAENRRILAEMLRVARRSAVVVDLRRSRLARRLFRLAAIPLWLGRVALHDGLLSVRQASTPAELRELAAGLPVVELRRRFPFRLSLVLDAKGSSGA